MLDFEGVDEDGRVQTVRAAPGGTPVRNPAFDVTPASLVAGIITEVGIVRANAAAIASACEGGREGMGGRPRSS